MEATEPKTTEDWATSLLQSNEPEAETEEPVEEQTLEAPVDDTDDEVEAAVEDDDATDDSEDDVQPDEIEADDPATEELYDYTVDGEERKATLKEALRSLSGQQYIQKGMQEVASKRKEAETVYTQLQNDREQLTQLLQQVQQQGLAPPPTAPDRKMLETDPIGYMQQQAEYQEASANYQQQQAQLQQYQSQQTEAQLAAHRAYVQDQQQQLLKDIPELADPKRGPAIMDGLRKTGEYYGFSVDELSEVYDGRTVRVLNDARKYRELTNGKANAKAKNARPVVKPGAVAKANVNAAQQKKRERLLKTGSKDAALDFIFNPGD